MMHNLRNGIQWDYSSKERLCGGVRFAGRGRSLLPQDARPEVFFISAERIPKNNSLLILSFLQFFPNTHEEINFHLWSQVYILVVLLQFNCFKRLREKCQKKINLVQRLPLEALTAG